MIWGRGATILLVMQVLVPLFPITIANLLQLANGHGFEPLADNMMGYGLVFVVLLASSLALGLYHRIKKPVRSEPIEDTFRYAGAGAAGSVMLMVAVDFSDDYFSGPSIGLAYPAIGFVLGSLFGGLFRLLYGRHVLRSTGNLER